ncbi:hypothetical protein BTVI_149166 [Pitangus sulphuratus]|nr:hypothetical protein BTVI_149166 [Pitangus sulphuratus]
MAVDVGKSLSEGSLSSGNAEDDGSWDCTEVEADSPELTDSLHRLSGAEGAKPSPTGVDVAISRHGHLATGVTQGGSSCHPEVSSAPAPGFPRARANLSGKETLISRGAAGGDMPPCVSHWSLSSEEQQVKPSGRWDPASSPPSRHSSAEENILAGSCHNTPVGRRRQSLGAQSSLPSTPELLQPQPPPSPGSALQSRSVLSLSALSSGKSGLSEEPSGSLPASMDVPSPAATVATRDLRAPFRDCRATVERIREVSSYQADYWACAIPDSLPPSPDRCSPHWNPNKEYEDLLDYAYPLKPRDPLQGLHLPADLRDTLDGMCRNEPRVKGHPVKSQQSESLVQCVKMFCCQLEELIRWLYDVADVTGSWVPPSPDAGSVTASLHRYLEFRKDVANHRSLTESVLERGEALLDCMASNSPALKDTLGLIAKQSEELESHAEHLYQSILAAVGPVQGKDKVEDEGDAAKSCPVATAVNPCSQNSTKGFHTLSETERPSLKQHNKKTKPDI